MENKAHSSKSYAVEGAVSRMEEDLESVLSGREFSTDPKRNKSGSKDTGDTRSRPHVCIVGAGLAGLKCAEVLNHHGIQTTMLEAQDHIGGRAAQILLDGHAVDPGPNWVHGTLTNPIVQLAKQTDTKLLALTDEPNMFDEHGQLIEAELVERLSELIWKIVSDAFRLSNAECATLSPTLSLKDFFREKLPEQGLEEGHQRLVLQMAEMWGSFIGDPWEKQSLKYYWLEECLDGDNLYVPDSHKSIVESIASAVKERTDIRLSTPVNRVQYLGSDNIKVHTATEILEFDDVVITVPLGCLKAQQPAFSPPLPSQVQEAIRQTTFSTLEKVWIMFPEPFWDLQKDHPSFTHFICPRYSTENPNAWTLEMQSLSAASLYGDLARPALLFSIYGPCAAHITSLVAGLDVNDPDYHARLDAFFRPYYSLMPNFDPRSPLCQPKTYLATDWARDQWCRGSYTNFQTCETELMGLDQALSTIRRGLPEEGLWFAGEHCAPYVATGTLTGAYWSGEVVAKRILHAYGFIDGHKLRKGDADSI